MIQTIWWPCVGILHYTKMAKQYLLNKGYYYSVEDYLNEFCKIGDWYSDVKNTRYF
jgi:hypothetical protein